MTLTQTLLLIIQIAFVLVMLYVSYIIFFHFKKKEFEKRKTIPLCPNCGSPNRQLSGLGGVVFPFTTSKFRCPDCGYEGIFVEVDKEKVTDFQKSLKKQKNEQD